MLIGRDFKNNVLWTRKLYKILRRILGTGKKGERLVQCGAS